MLYTFNSFYLPATKKMLPKLLTLLQYCHDYGQTSNRWFFYLQEIIQYHFKAEGKSFCYGDTREIVRGEKDYRLDQYLVEVIERLSFV